MKPAKRRSIVLRERPLGPPDESTFQLIEDAVPDPADGQIVTRTIWLSLDPYMRGRLSESKSYAKPVAVGGVMEGETVGQVMKSRAAGWAVGDYAVGPRGWQTHVVCDGRTAVKIDAATAPLSAFLGVLGMPGTTAYSGLKDIGVPKSGETIVVSAASGPVGSVAGQLARRAGAKVVGIAGGPEKCGWVTGTLGFDACIDHRAPDLPGALRQACPNGIDVYFENVGGDVQQAVFPLLNDFARVVMCGMVAEYNDRQQRPGPNLMPVVRKRLHIQGLIVSDKPERFAEWRILAAPWLQDGSLRFREDVIEGLEHAPQALIGLLSGRNFGKLLVRVGPDRM